MTVADHPRRPVRIHAIGAALLLVTLPLARGGVPALARGMLVLTAALLLAVEWAPRAVTGPRMDRRERAWLGVWSVVVGLLAVQLMPLPGWLLEQLGAQPREFTALSDVAVRRITPVPAATFHFGALFTAYWSVAWVVSRLPRRQVSWVVAALLGLAVFEALYGTISLARGSQTILGVWSREHYPGDATGTYVNRNPYAGLLALAWPVGLAWLGMQSFAPTRGTRAAARWAACGLFSAVIGVALVASHSRMGLVSGIAGLGLWLLVRRAAGRRVDFRFEASIAIVALAGAIWFGVTPLVDRLLELPLSRERWIAWQALLDLPDRTWILGAGAGSFADVFKTVQPAVLHKSLLHAHSDWIELLFDFGVVGVAAIGVAALLWWRRVRPTRLGPLQHGALAGIAAVAVHALADFDLHVPGTALAFWVLVGVVANAHLSGPAARRQHAV